jgi:hypothetical protein
MTGFLPPLHDTSSLIRRAHGLLNGHAPEQRLNQTKETRYREFM